MSYTDLIIEKSSLAEVNKAFSYSIVPTKTDSAPYRIDCAARLRDCNMMAGVKS